MARQPQEKKYLVVVQPAQPKPRIGQGVGNVYSQASWIPWPPVAIKTITAASAKAAAEKANPEPGATVYVAQLGYVEKFERPEKAPLVKKAA